MKHDISTARCPAKHWTRYGAWSQPHWFFGSAESFGSFQGTVLTMAVEDMIWSRVVTGRCKVPPENPKDFRVTFRLVPVPTKTESFG